MQTSNNTLSSSKLFSIETLIFSKNMQNAGISQKFSDQLAINLKVMKFGFIETLLTKNEFHQEMKNLNLNLTIRMAIIMASRIGIIGA